MMLRSENYLLNPDVTESQLKNAGFRNNVFRCFIYKNMIQFVMEVDLDEKSWSYSVNDSNTDDSYPQYYNRGYGKNLVIEELDTKVKKIIREMQKSKILINKRRMK